MNRSFAAFLIALLLHLVLLLSLYILLLELNKQNVEKKPEKRFKVSLKEKPQAKQSAALNNKLAKKAKLPPIPKGKQLKKVAKAPSFSQKKPPQKPPKKLPKKSSQTKKQKKSQVSKPTKELTNTSMASRLSSFKRTKPTSSSQHDEKNSTQDKNSLYTKLSQPSKEEIAQQSKEQHSKRENLINQDIKELYGEDFAKLSEGEQKYILDNQEIIRRTTQEVLNRVGRINIPDNFRVNSDNIIEFYLHPNGDISDIKLIKKSGFYLLDSTTKETIEYAYSKYPPVHQKTLIRFKVGYYLRGY